MHTTKWSTAPYKYLLNMPDQPLQSGSSEATDQHCAAH